MTRNRFLFLVWLLLTAVALGVQRPWQGDSHSQTSSTIRPLFPALGFNAHRTAVIEISGPDGSVTLRKGDSAQADYVWKVVNRFGHPVDLVRIQHLMDGLASLTTRDVVSVEPSSHKVYKVEEGASTRVRVLDDRGVVMADLLGGGLRKQDPTAGNRAILAFYIRPTQTDTVYLTSDYSAASTSPSYWCDTWFLREVEKEDVRSAERVDHDGKESWKIVRTAKSEEEVGWKMVAPLAEEIPAFAGDSWVHSLRNLRAEEIVSNQRDDPRFGKTTDIFRVGIGDHLFELRLGSPAGMNRRYAQIVGLPFLYVIAQHEVDQFRQTIADMLKVETD